MDELSLARAVHVVSIVAWIGGVYFVTFILLPSVRQMADSEDRAAALERFEHRFALHARVATLAAGASGFYITHLLDAWDRFADSSYWWMHAMTAIWAVFTLVLFVLEPLFLHAWFSKRAREHPEATFTLVTQLHRILLAVSLITVVGAVLGAHG